MADAPIPSPPSLLPPLSRSPLPVRASRSRARWSKAFLSLGGVAILGTGGWGVVNFGFTRGQRDDVLTAQAAVGDLVILISDKGELESSESVQVMCEIEGGGKLVTIHPEGTRVKAGEVVGRFDTDALLKAINEQEVKWELAEAKVKSAASELEVQKNKAESEIAKAELALTLARLDRDAYEQGEYQVELDKRKGTLELSKKELKEAEDTLDFTRAMVRKGFSQMEQIRVMELAFESKRYAVQQQDADLRVFRDFTKIRKETEFKAKALDAERELDRTKKSQVAATEKADSETKATRKTADLEKQQLARLKGQLDKCELKAPSDGIVVYFKRPWDESSRIRPGAAVYFQQPIFTLPDLNKMKVKMKVHESVVKKVHAGLTATMKVDAQANLILHGKVVSIATLAQGDDWRGAGVKEYETEVSVDDLPPDAGLRPGMSAEVKILVKTVPGALTVPVQSVTEVKGVHVCYVADGDRVTRREVKVGDGNEQLIQVLEGLSPGERVALDARTRAIAELGPAEAEKQTKEPSPSEGAPQAAPPG